MLSRTEQTCFSSGKVLSFYFFLKQYCAGKAIECEDSC